MSNHSPTSIGLVPSMREAARSAGKMELVDVLIGVGKFTRERSWSESQIFYVNQVARLESTESDPVAMWKS
jgi:hypothetical protein